MPRVCNGCLAAAVDAVYGTVPAADTIHDPATCELVPPIAPTLAPTLPVTTITIRWEGDPAELDAALAYAEDVLVACGGYTDDEREAGALAAAVLRAMQGDGNVTLPDSLGVARATTGVCPECERPAADPEPHKVRCGRREGRGLELAADRSER